MAERCPHGGHPRHNHNVHPLWQCSIGLGARFAEPSLHAISLHGTAQLPPHGDPDARRAASACADMDDDPFIGDPCAFSIGLAELLGSRQPRRGWHYAD